MQDANLPVMWHAVAQPIHQAALAILERSGSLLDDAAMCDCLIHTNHCLCPETQARQPDDAEHGPFGVTGLPENSVLRYHTLERTVPKSPRTVAGMQAILRDRSLPGAISQRGERGRHTVCAMIVAPAQGKIWGAEGYPPDVPFTEYRV